MSNKKAPETPVEKYYKLSRDLKHYKKTFETSQRNVEKTEKALTIIKKKLWFCPACNHPAAIPHKRDTKELIMSLENKFYKCKFAVCPCCEKEVLIEKVYIDED